MCSRVNILLSLQPNCQRFTFLPCQLFTFLSMPTVYHFTRASGLNFLCAMFRSPQLDSESSRSGSSLSLRNNSSLTPRSGGGVSSGGGGAGGDHAPPSGGGSSSTSQSQSPSHRGVHRSVSATNAKTSRRLSAGNGGVTAALTCITVVNP